MNKRTILRFMLRHPILFEIFKLSREIPDIKRGRRQFRADLKKYSNSNRTSFKIENEFIYPCLTDRYKEAGNEGQYFWQDLWAARHIFTNRPKEHYDIGSRIDGFIAHLACFMDNIHLIDVRPFDMNIPGVDFKQADATKMVEMKDDSVVSISALCSLEHFGLGRYGDPVDPDACFEAMKSIQRVMAPGGHAYISVPIGYEHLEFNAQRIFYAKTVKDMFDECDLIEFSVTDGSCIEKNIAIDKYDDERDNMGGRFGLFHFQKKS